LATLNRKLLHECLSSFSECTGVPSTLYTPEGAILEEFLEDQKFCRFFNIYKNPGQCRKSRLFSSQLSYEMGEPYIYYCPVGLVHIAVPVILDKEYCACAIAGPIAMGEVDERYLNQAIAMDSSAISQVAKIALFISKMKVYTPTQVQELSTLFFGAVLQSHKNWVDYDQMRSRHNQTLEMGEHIRKQKEGQSTASPAAPALTCAELQDRLIQLLRKRDQGAALACLDELINELILVEGSNFDSVKLRLFELYITLSRVGSEAGVSLQKIFGDDFDLISDLNKTERVEDFSRWSEHLVDHFVGEVFSDLQTLSDSVARAVNYIAAHYMEKLTLRDLAAKLFVSDSYLSKLFRQELGTNFTDYLNKIRIDHSIDLMQSTSLNLLEISGMVGFEDQSYFTKVFKRVTGHVPKQYKPHPAVDASASGAENAP